MIIHIVPKVSSRNKYTLEDVKSTPGVTNVQEQRAVFFGYSLITAEATAEAIEILKGNSDIEAVSEDEERRINQSETRIYATGALPGLPPDEAKLRVHIFASDYFQHNG